MSTVEIVKKFRGRKKGMHFVPYAVKIDGEYYIVDTFRLSKNYADARVLVYDEVNGVRRLIGFSQ